ncbi:MAG: N-acetyl-gamma-glutamyl-phosphate reductase [Peptostreptococcaceae bacterium]
MKKINVGIIGATGYVGMELIRILSSHSMVDKLVLGSNSFVGNEIKDIYTGIYQKLNSKCIENDKVILESDFIFTALPHGVSEEFVLKALEQGKKVIDMGADFRLKNEEEFYKWYEVSFIDKDIHKEAIYGLSEINKEKIKTARVVANPGCYPTSISLPLIPLLSKKLIEKENIIIDSKSGVTGSGRGLSLGTHYPEINENIYAYKIGNHRHTPEIEQNLSEAYGENVKVVFTPTLIPVNRGILSTIYCKLEKDIDIEKIYEQLTEYYGNDEFVEIMDIGKSACIKNVKLSNKCQISIHENNNTLIICSAIDNMVKGSAGQGVQNMNIMMGFEENDGLDSLPPAF